MLSHLPDSARIWTFTADRPLAPGDLAAIETDLGEFLQHWASHGRAVPGGVHLVADRFLVVAAHLEGGVSGCGIDSLVHAVEAVGERIGVEWVDGLRVVYRGSAGDVRVTTRPEFRKLVRSGAVDADTPVFDTTLTSLGELREGGLERPAGSTWHARVFHLLETA